MKDYRSAFTIHHSQFAIVLCGLLFFVMPPVLYAAPPKQTGTATLTLTNDSEETICSVHISLVTADSWGDNWLGENETIEPGQRQNFALEPGNYDVLLLDCDAEMLLAEQDLSITDRYDLSFTDVDPCASWLQAGMSLDPQTQYLDALDQLQQANTCYQEAGNRAGEGQSLNLIGFIYDGQGQTEAALDYYRQGLTIMQEIGNQDEEIHVLNLIGDIYHRLGQLETALSYYQQGLTISQAIGDQGWEGVDLNKIGFIYDSLGQYEDALDYYRQALTISQEEGDRVAEGTNLNNVGGIYESRGQYETALDYFQQALSIRQANGDRQGEAESLNNIGIIYAGLGQLEIALDYYQQALTISQEESYRLEEGTTLNNIGAIYENMGQLETALDYYQQALIIRQEEGDRAGEGTTLNNIGGIYKSLEQYEDALDYYQQGLEVRKASGDRAGEGESLNNIGFVYDNLRRHEDALASYNKALEIMQESGNRAGEWVTLYNIGTSYYIQGQYDDALDYLQQAMLVFESVRSVAGSEQGRTSFVDQYIGLYHTMVLLFHRQGQAEQAFQITEQSRARTLLDALATGHVRLRDDDAAELLAQEQQFYDQRQVISLELAEAQANNPDRVAELEQDLAEAEAAYQDIQAAIAARGAELAALVPGRSADTVLGVEEVQARLDQQTTLVAYYLLPDTNALAFVLTPTRFETVELEVTPDDLFTHIRDFRDFASLDAAHPASTVTLYEMLIAPLKDKLVTSHLVIVPHQSLHYLPFAALTDGERYLIDDYTLTVLPSASVLPFIQDKAEQTASSGQPVPLILGNPVTGEYDASASLVVTESEYRDRLGALPGAEREANAIADLFGVESLIGEAATETAVRERVGQANILHLAAHGKFNPAAPLNSLIALAPDDEYNGWLTVGEVYGLDLRHTNLVVLSACETNLGDLSKGDDLVGLTRAFIFAGTPTVIASLWAVEDEATSLLMERFYTHLQAGLGKAAALRQAQLEVREEYPNPYFWSAFVLSGDGGPVAGSEDAGEQGPAPAVTSEEEQTAGGCLNLMVMVSLLGVVGLFAGRRQRSPKNQIKEP